MIAWLKVSLGASSQASLEYLPVPCMLLSHFHLGWPLNYSRHSSILSFQIWLSGGSPSLKPLSGVWQWYTACLWGHCPYLLRWTSAHLEIKHQPQIQAQLSLLQNRRNEEGYRGTVGFCSKSRVWYLCFSLPSILEHTREFLELPLHWASPTVPQNIPQALLITQLGKMNKWMNKQTSIIPFLFYPVIVYVLEQVKVPLNHTLTLLTFYLTFLPPTFTGSPKY